MTQAIRVRVLMVLLVAPVACSSGAGGKSGVGGTTGAGGASASGGASAGAGGAAVPTGLLDPDITTTWNPGILADTQLNMPLGADGLPVRTTVCANPKPGDDLNAALAGCAGRPGRAARGGDVHRLLHRHADQGGRAARRRIAGGGRRRHDDRADGDRLGAGHRHGAGSGLLQLGVRDRRMR